MGKTLYDSFGGSDSTALIIPSKPTPFTRSYTELRKDISVYQSKLAAIGTRHEDAVSIVLPNSFEFVVSFLATTWQRAIACPLNSAYKQDEVEFYVNDMKSSLVIVPRGWFAKDAAAVRAARKFGAAIAECFWDGREVQLDVKERGSIKARRPARSEQAQPDDVALVLHTSGTTGRPKAVPLSHRNLTRTMHNIKQTYKLSATDRTLLVMPLFHVHGLLAGFLAPLGSSGSIIVPNGFSASSFWEDFTTHKANWYTAVPTIHQILLKNPPPNPKPKIRFIRSCSSPLSPKTFHELEKTFDAPVLEAYAMTEAAHQMTSNPLPPAKREPGKVGIGHGVEVKILDAEGNELQKGKEGEICARGENITKGYINNPEANKSSFTREGFFRTGDQGKQDEDGFVTITGRIKELINKGGEKVSPIEIDNVVSRHEAVGEAVSFAMEDEMYGQDIGVAVVLKEGEKLSADQLREWMTDKVVKFKLPKKIYFTDVMPKTATGKIQRRMVAEAMKKKEETSSKL